MVAAKCKGSGCSLLADYKAGKFRLTDSSCRGTRWDFYSDTHTGLRYRYKRRWYRYHRRVQPWVYLGLKLAIRMTGGLEVSCLRSAHSKLTTSGNVSDHWSGNAADISAIRDGPKGRFVRVSTWMQSQPRFLWMLKRTVKACKTIGATQEVSLHDFDGPTGNRGSFALANHYDHVHCGW